MNSIHDNKNSKKNMSFFQCHMIYFKEMLTKSRIYLIFFLIFYNFLKLYKKFNIWFENLFKKLLWSFGAFAIVMT